MKKTNQKIKKLTVIGMTVIIAMLSAALSGCGCQRGGENTATIDEIATTTVEPATVETLNETDQAIVDEGLTVDKNGNITDKEGNKVEVSEDGKVKVKTADGKTVEVDADKVKDANENNDRVQKVNATVNNNSNKTSGSGNSNTSSNKNSSSSGNKNNNSDKKSQSSNSSSAANKNNSSSNNSSSSKTETKNDSSSSNSSSSNSSSSGKQESSKTEETKHTHSWTDITKSVKVIDKKAYSYEEPVYETIEVQICWGCGARVGNGDMTAEERRNHMKQHKLNGEETGYHNDYVTEQAGTKTVNVPEEYHYETKTVGRKCSSCGKTEYY